MDKKKNGQEPTMAPGMNDQEELKQDANDEEIDKGEYTKVTRLSFDEVEPS